MTHIFGSGALLFLSLIVLALQMLYLHRLGTSKHYEQTAEEMREHIVWGLFYINPDDPRAWLPKYRLPGYTVNFRTRANAIIFSIIILTTLGTALWMSWTAFGEIG